MPRFVKVSSKLAVSHNFSGSILSIQDFSHPMLLNDIKTLLTECKEELQDVKEERKNILVTIQLRQAKNSFLRAKETDWT